MEAMYMRRKTERIHGETKERSDQKKETKNEKRRKEELE